MKNSKKKLICGTLIAATVVGATASIIVHNQKEKCLNKEMSSLDVLG